MSKMAEVHFPAEEVTTITWTNGTEKLICLPACWLPELWRRQVMDLVALVSGLQLDGCRQRAYSDVGPAGGCQG